MSGIETATAAAGPLRRFRSLAEIAGGEYSISCSRDWSGMLSEELRRRISEMNRTAGRQHPLPSAGRPWDAGMAGRPSRPRHLSLEEMVQGEELVWPPSRFLRIEKPLQELCRTADQFMDHYRSSLRQRESRLSEENPDFLPLVSHPLSSWIFLDIETCGLTNSPVFLVGLFYYRDGQFRVEQLLARDYGEEAAILHYLALRLAEFSALLTFNGKSFDWPFLVDRGSIYGAVLNDPGVHFDVLHAARKRWKGALPNCKLQTLEQHVCGRRRYGDIPGALIPEAYHHFVKTGNALQLRDIVHHNALDLFTTSEVTLHLLSGGDASSL